MLLLTPVEMNAIECDYRVRVANAPAPPSDNWYPYLKTY